MHHSHGTIKYRTIPAESVNQYTNDVRLTNKIHTTPYNSAQRKDELVNKCCHECSTVITDCCDNCSLISKWIIPFTILIIFSCAFIVGAAVIIDETARSAQYRNSLNIEGECELLNITKKYDLYHKEGEKNTYTYVYTYKWDVVNLTICQQIGYDEFEEKFDEKRYDVGDIVICWTNQDCDGIHVITKDSGSDSVTGSWIACIFVFGLAFCCLGGAVWFWKNIEYPKYVGMECSDIECKLCCHYIVGIDKKKHKYEQAASLGNDEIFDYYMSYYDRKYDTKLGDNVYNLVWCMLFGGK